MPQVLRNPHSGGPGGAGCSAPNGGSMGFHRHRFGAAGAIWIRPSVYTHRDCCVASRWR